MADVQWIKITTNIFENRKIKQIEQLPEGDAIIVIWVRLLCLAGTINESGTIRLTDKMPYTDEMLAREFNKPVTTVRLAINTFQQFDMIEITDNGSIYIPNWEKHQNIDGLERIRVQNRLRKQRQRERAKLNNSNTKALPEAVSRDVTGQVTQSHAIDKNKIDKEKNINKKRFIEPTVDQVREYCTRNNHNIDPEAFVDYYTANGWKVGKNKMKDWKAAVRTWARNDNNNNNNNNSQSNNKPIKLKETFIC